MQSLIEGFIAETIEWLEQLERDVGALRDRPRDEALLEGVFRIFHNVKGNAGMCALPRLEALAHAAETLLVSLREGRRDAADPDVERLLLASTDAIRASVTHLSHHGTEPLTDHAALRDALKSLAESTATPDPSPPGRADSAGVAPAAVETATEGDLWIGFESRVRIDVTVLDGLLERVQHLSSLATRLRRHAAGRVDDPALPHLSRALDEVSADLEVLALEARLQPIGVVWDKYPRLARRVQASTGKHFDVRTHGRETRLDRTIIEAIKDPMTHLVRNALVHGIEPPTVRVQAGKHPVGRIDLSAYAGNPFVHIEISDDGAGIDPERARARAVELGLMTAEEARTLSTEDALNLVFRPGFSLAPEVSRLSGRGVGLDVVKANLERVGGQFHIESRVGWGTTFVMRIPAALSYVEALVVAWGRHRYAVPEDRLIEIVRVSRHDRAQRIGARGGIPTWRLRENEIPLVFPPAVEGAPLTWDVIVVLQGGESLFGLVANAVLGSERLVVRPMARSAGDDCAGASPSADTLLGTASRGDAEPIWVLDAAALARTIAPATASLRARRTRSTGSPAPRRERRPSPRTGEPKVKSAAVPALPRRALIVDDSATMRALMRRMLTDMGFQTHEALHGRQALEQLETMDNPELIMVDWNMPEMDGIEFIRTIRANPRYTGVTVVMVSTEADHRKVEQALEAGADDYIEKPFKPSIIAKKVGLVGWIAR